VWHYFIESHCVSTEVTNRQSEFSSPPIMRGLRSVNRPSVLSVATMAAPDRRRTRRAPCPLPLSARPFASTSRLAGQGGDRPACRPPRLLGGAARRVLRPWRQIPSTSRCGLLGPRMYGVRPGVRSGVCPGVCEVHERISRLRDRQGCELCHRCHVAAASAHGWPFGAQLLSKCRDLGQARGTSTKFQPPAISVQVFVCLYDRAVNELLHWLGSSEVPPMLLARAYQVQRGNLTKHREITGFESARRRARVLDFVAAEIRGSSYAGGRKNLEINPMDRPRLAHVAQQSRSAQVSQRGAKTRAGSPCRRPPVHGRKRCRLHGGLSPGAPRGSRNGNYTTGDWTADAIEERQWLRSLVRDFAKAETGR